MDFVKQFVEGSKNEGFQPVEGGSANAHGQGMLGNVLSGLEGQHGNAPAQQHQSGLGGLMSNFMQGNQGQHAGTGALANTLSNYMEGNNVPQPGGGLGGMLGGLAGGNQGGGLGSQLVSGAGKMWLQQQIAGLAGNNPALQMALMAIFNKFTAPQATAAGTAHGIPQGNALSSVSELFAKVGPILNGSGMNVVKPSDDTIQQAYRETDSQGKGWLNMSEFKDFAVKLLTHGAAQGTQPATPTPAMSAAATRPVEAM